MIRAIQDKVVIKPLYDRDITAGGIIIPDEAKERCDQGIVVVTGPDVKDIKIGQHVLFGGYDGTYVGLEGEGDFIILDEDAIKLELFSPNTVCPGLYFKDKDGNYFTATVESAWQMIASALAGLEMFKKARFSNRIMPDKREE